jgi:hypothetical protein
MKNKVDEAAFTEFLSRVLKTVETEADIDELAELKKIYKKAVPFFRRSYVGAYLAKLVLSEGKFVEKFSRLC